MIKNQRLYIFWLSIDMFGLFFWTFSPSYRTRNGISGCTPDFGVNEFLSATGLLQQYTYFCIHIRKRLRKKNENFIWTFVLWCINKSLGKKDSWKKRLLVFYFGFFNKTWHLQFASLPVQKYFRILFLLQLRTTDLLSSEKVPLKRINERIKQ